MNKENDRSYSKAMVVSVTPDHYGRVDKETSFGFYHILSNDKLSTKNC